MEDELDKEIIEVLNTPIEDMESQSSIPENQSPLNQGVKTGDIADTKATEQANGSFRKKAETQHAFDKAQEELEDAPEQPIHTDKESSSNHTTDTSDAVIPNAQSLQTAEALLGMADNVIAVGAGYFIKVRKHQEFYEYEEIVQIIDEQNEKNIKRVCLDEDDKALLKPLLAIVLQNKAKQLTPEQQLFGAATAIIIKKIQIVLEMRSENRSLEDRLLQIIADSKKDKIPPQPSPTADQQRQAASSVFITEDDEPFEDVDRDMLTPLDQETQDNDHGMAVVYEQAPTTHKKVQQPSKASQNTAKGASNTPKKATARAKRSSSATTQVNPQQSDDTS